MEFIEYCSLDRLCYVRIPEVPHGEIRRPPVRAFPIASHGPSTIDAQTFRSHIADKYYCLPLRPAGGNLILFFSPTISMCHDHAASWRGVKSAANASRQMQPNQLIRFTDSLYQSDQVRGPMVRLPVVSYRWRSTTVVTDCRRAHDVSISQDLSVRDLVSGIHKAPN